MTVTVKLEENPASKSNLESPGRATEGLPVTAGVPQAAGSDAGRDGPAAAGWVTGTDFRVKLAQWSVTGTMAS